jgi:TldD protein
MPHAYFLERRTLTHIQTGPAGHVRMERDEGYARVEKNGGDFTHRWRSLKPGILPPELPAQMQALARSLRLQVDEEAEKAKVQHTAEWLSSLLSQTPDARALARLVERSVVVGSDAAWHSDVQRYVLLEMKASVTVGNRRTQAQEERAFSSVDALLAARASLETQAHRLVERALQKQTAVACPRGALPVVFPPGADAAVFFHELCGHPLEADVVARGCSYLGLRRGRPVAPDFVTVVDDPTREGGALSYRLDDEGQVAKPVPLVQNGQVAGPLLDMVTAEGLGLAANGHGRRTDYRHPPLPRMAHTELRPHQGTLEEILAPVEHGVLVHFLTPRHVDILRGDFSFYIVEAQLIERGRAGPFIEGGVLRGNGLTALAAIEAVGHDWAPFFGLKGCGKLDHGPLPVSFGNPSVRFSALEVQPWS